MGVYSATEPVSSGFHTTMLDTRVKLVSANAGIEDIEGTLKAIEYRTFRERGDPHISQRGKLRRLRFVVILQDDGYSYYEGEHLLGDEQYGATLHWSPKSSGRRATRDG